MINTKISRRKVILFGFLILTPLLLGYIVLNYREKMSQQGTLDLISQLNCVAPESLPTIIPANEGHVLLSWTDSQSTTTNLQLIDIKNDTVKHNLQLNGWWDLRDIRFSDGSFVIYDVNNNQFQFLNQNLENIGGFTPENKFGIFSHDRKNYFFLKGHILYRTELESLKTTRVEIPYNLHIANIVSIHPTKDQIALHYFFSPYSDKRGTAIFDLTSGNLLMLHEDVFQVDFYDNTTYLLKFEDQETTYSITYGKEKENFHYAHASFFQDNNDLSLIPGSNYLLGIKNEESVFYNLGKEITTYLLADSGIRGAFNSACFIPEDKLIVGAVFENGASNIYALNTEKIPFSKFSKPEKVSSPLTVNPNLADAYWGQLSDDDLPNDMNEVKTFANELEKKYGVKILLSNECKEICSSCEYDILTTDKMNYTDEPQKIARFLNALDQALALYPKDFFTQFRNSFGKGGIRFMPIGQIKSTIGTEGVCYRRYEWNNIAVVVDSEDLVSLLCHEIWHATENKILSTIYNEFTIQKWNSLNPPNFEYYEDKSLLDPSQHKWTLFSSESEEVYFVDYYARLNEHEDRAKIMEYIMTKDDFTDAMIKSPAIFKKYRLMCEAIRKSFNTTEWNNVRWERFLKNKQ